MNEIKKNIFENVPLPGGKDEIFENILSSGNVRVERIISSGQVSPADFWYDQDEHEWVMLLQGSATIEYTDGSKADLIKGDYLFLPAHRKHRVAYTSSAPECIWLAIFWK